MAEITAALVKELRERSGAGMMDCKKALTESAGDIEAAVDWLRKKGLAAAAKKAGRVAAEGLVALEIAGGKGALVEVNAETDFVGRNDKFQDFVRKVATLAVEKGADIATLPQQTYPGESKPVAEKLTQLIATIGENMTLRRSAGLSVKNGIVATYVHNQTAPGLGKIGVLVALESTGDAGQLMTLGKQLAMHVAAANPQAVDVTGLDPAVVAREKEVLADKFRQQGKPANVIEKIVESGLKTYYKEVCLLEQAYIHEPDKSVAQALKESEGKAGGPIKVTGFVRYALGEGIEKQESDFAAEVAAAAKS